MMLYLSDPIYIERDFSEMSPIGSYISYAVHIRPIGLNPITFEKSPFNLIYRGHIFVTGKLQRVYLNDIITPHMYEHNYIKPKISMTTTGRVAGMTESDFDFPNSMSRVRVTYDNSTISDELDIVQYYADNQGHVTLTPDIEERISTYAPRIINFLNYRTTVYPRVPRLPIVTYKFWLGAKIATTPFFWDESDMDGIPCLTWTGESTGDSDEWVSTYIQSDQNCYSQIAWNITGENYSRLSRMESSDIYIAAIDEDNFGDYFPSTENKKRTKIATFDECPSDFYLIWMDRSGAYQCQPFNKKVYRKENITTTSVVNSIEEKRPILKSVTNTWTLHSDWLSFSEYEAYESIFTSPYIYLFDYKNDEGYWVNCTNKSWDEKNERNTNKPFNLTITLESIQPQNIRY